MAHYILEHVEKGFVESSLLFWLREYDWSGRKGKLKPVGLSLITLDRTPPGFIDYLRQYCDTGVGGTEFTYTDYEKDLNKWMLGKLRAYVLNTGKL